MPKPTRNQIYDAVIRRMVHAAMEDQELAFAQTHGADGEEVLLGVLTGAANALGHSPWPEEFIGGRLIEQRFGSWEEALHRAGLELPSQPYRMERNLRWQEENRRQRLIYRQRKEEKKRKARERMENQAKNC